MVEILRKHCIWTRDNDEKWDFLLVVDKIYPAVQPFGQLWFFASFSLLTFVSPPKYFSKLLWYPTYTNICLRSWTKVFNLASTFYSSHTSICWTSIHFFACDILAPHDLIQIVKSSKRKVGICLVHSCTIFLCCPNGEIDDPYRGPNMNDRENLVGLLTRICPTWLYPSRTHWGISKYFSLFAVWPGGSVTKKATYVGIG